MKEVYIISTGDIVAGRIAGAQRVMKISKSIASGGVSVFLCSLPYLTSDDTEPVELFPGISILRSKTIKCNNRHNIISFLKKTSSFIESRESEPVIYLYPTSFVFYDLVYTLYLQLVKGYRLYCDLNELRSTNVFSATPPLSIPARVLYYLKGSARYFMYKLNELQVYLYTGAVVISTNLEKYYSKKVRRLIRIPILCDVEASKGIKKPDYDGQVFRICFSGMVSCRKEGFDLLFEALSLINRTRKVELYLYGPLSNEDEDSLNNLKKKFLLDNRVYYVGNLDPDDLQDEFSKYHLLILPRPLNPQTRYGFSTKLSDYLISGVPVLVTDVSDNSIYIRDGINGYLIPPGSMSALEAKLMEIIDNYNQSSILIARNALETAARELDYRNYTDKLIDFLFKPTGTAYKLI
jgi:glycosyltransferase involved in cell wall biosynthesis